MTSAARRAILKANAAFLGLFGTVAFFMLDVRAIWFDSGPQAAILRGEPAAGVGFLEAHGLAVVLAVWFWRWGCAASPDPAGHLTAAVVHAFLGTCNIALWRIFVVADVLALGYVSTALHIAFAVAQVVAARSASRSLGAGAT
jgi:hypothetical protein